MSEHILESGHGQRTEYRALIHRPPTAFATAKERRQGYVERWTKPYPTKDLKVLRQDDYELCRSEETWATFVRWEERVVLFGPWKDSE